MDDRTRAVFIAHVKKLESQALAGDEDAIRSIACMALLTEGFRPQDPDDGIDAEIIDLSSYLKVAA